MGGRGSNAVGRMVGSKPKSRFKNAKEEPKEEVKEEKKETPVQEKKTVKPKTKATTGKQVQEDFKEALKKQIKLDIEKAHIQQSVWKDNRNGFNVDVTELSRNEWSAFRQWAMYQQHTYDVQIQENGAKVYFVRVKRKS